MQLFLHPPKSARWLPKSPAGLGLLLLWVLVGFSYPPKGALIEYSVFDLTEYKGSSKKEAKPIFKHVHMIPRECLWPTKDTPIVSDEEDQRRPLVQH